MRLGDNRERGSLLADPVIASRALTREDAGHRRSRDCRAARTVCGGP
jgi:hypothetical protein